MDLWIHAVHPLLKQGQPEQGACKAYLKLLGGEEKFKVGMERNRAGLSFMIPKAHKQEKYLRFFGKDSDSG